MRYDFTDRNGTFLATDTGDTSYLYLPIASPSGVLSCITPTGRGDSRLSQDRYLLPPVVVEDLQQSMVGRNFWFDIEGIGLRSAFGFSLAQLALRQSPVIEGGMLWQKTSLEIADGITCETLDFAPVGTAKTEIMQVTVTNNSGSDIKFTPSAAVPIFARGADHIRDHRHVTSLLNVIRVKDIGVEVEPTMAFDERGHHRNSDVYAVYGRDGAGNAPEDIFPTVVSYAGEGGNLLDPYGASAGAAGMAPGSVVSGEEAFAGLKFESCTLKPGETAVYNIIMSFGAEGYEYLDSANIATAFDALKEYWKDQKIIHTATGDDKFDGWMEWVSVQPQLRKLYGCSFLPYHDYGRGGRGWRDLWQDSLALLLRDPSKAREDLVSYFAGIRTDGSNATIIGTKRGEFIADRNGIARVWMDHGFWPMFTVNLYLEQTGDYDFLFEKEPYFKDRQIMRGEAVDESFEPGDNPRQRTAAGEIYEGSLIEHLLVQQVTQYFDRGEHGNMRLRGADWNDALDMASKRGESVAFTAAYAGSIKMLADMIRASGRGKIEVFEELASLLDSADASVSELPAILADYEKKVASLVSGERVEIDAEDLISRLEKMSESIKSHIRSGEIVSDGEGNSWFNGYYDNDAERVEGVTGGGVRMMLTSQVFTVMFGTATEDMVRDVIKAADKYLYAPALGGYRLNTDFHEVKMNMGRAFGFAYGEKENGAVFCHMAVMYAYALYSRGFAREGYKVFDALYRQSVAEGPDGGRMYPGIPEYFNGRGRGMYPYLTGAASWAVMLVLKQMFGVSGRGGRLVLAPALLAGQFGDDGRAEVSLYHDGRPLKVTYVNPGRKDFGEYKIARVTVGGTEYSCGGTEFEVPAESLKGADSIVVELK